MSAEARTSFAAACRHWRHYRRLSQLELALAAQVSQRHLSWLETGRSKPSRDMVLRLAEALSVPLRERNALLRAAGFAPQYAESSIDAPAMAAVRDAIARVLEHHEPLPAVVVDRVWNVVKSNEAAGRLFAMAGDVSELLRRTGSPHQLNLAILSLHPLGFRPFIRNWEQIAPSLVRRLRSEALASGDPVVAERFEAFIALAQPLDEAEPAAAGLLPILPLELDFGSVTLRLFSVISTFGTPQDITTDEWRVEALYPADAQTADFFARSAGRGSSSP